MQEIRTIFRGLLGFLIGFVTLTGLQIPQALANEKLPALGLSKNSVTVSGISSGAFMAVQLGVAYSETFKGVAAIAGGIYGCSEGKADTATKICMKDPEKINPATAVEMVKQSFQKGQVDDPSHLAQQRVFILHGTEDKTILLAAGQKLKEFYTQFKNHPTTEFGLKMGHGFPTSNAKNDCEASKFPWLNNCNYDGAKSILEAMYGPLKSTAITKNSGELLVIDQSEFTKSEAKMLDYGHLYLPAACKDKKTSCRLHVALHGCLQAPSLAKKSFVEEAGYNDWAARNNIVILYPAATMSAGNPTGCWDWFGYTGENYAVKSSLQMTAIMAMIQRLTESN